ncbi:HAD family hydrolase [Bordetella holmesii]|uniref:HAD hydrolase, family IA, variant 3 n=2 Tax=Bordetella holmesii TaxID=35814 RepID=A0A158M666_9BORD|nr:HAD family hydrolase [Bordetella holmesii]AHV92082.1 HAD hydrolase, IA, variant 1 family protein [Bordetella holmesii ATCC 51541]AIT25417.1 HAD hydrolase, IA, variant 1 family protein [Bordetella holmesii 44057]EWM48499.1 HAD hydrolase, IA, variant 1 family protein [Bordetella holmesii 41130]EWM50114.1 HAD hydrolase, IA, variant 1 family protein [Bordetella holmesii 35009]AMD44613.1 phosphoglycolate phosphatase [Bordetella holmesii H558]
MNRATTELVIFDCDGVLIDSEIIAARAQSQALAAHGIDISPQDAARRFAGIPDHDMWLTLQSESSIRLPADFESDYAAHLAKVFESELRALPHAQDLITTLRARGVPYCVASSSTPEKLRKALGLTGLWPLFEPHVFSVSQVRRGKPAPDIFLFAAKQMGVAPECCLVIEDSVPGVTAARAAGMPVLGYTGASHIAAGHDARLRHAGALGTVGDLADVNAYVL